MTVMQERSSQAWSIKDSLSTVYDIREHLLFARMDIYIRHKKACDTTSAICGKSKVAVLKVFRKSDLLRDTSKVFNNPNNVGTASMLAFQCKQCTEQRSNRRKSNKP